MKSLKGLYVIADVAYIGNENFLASVTKVLSAGAKIIQYRDKINDYTTRLTYAKKIKLLTNQWQALLIINDDVMLSKEVDADGVHIGKEDCTILEASSVLKENKIIGVSCYNKFSDAKIAKKAGANYIAFGSFYPSQIKPDAPRADIELILQAKKELNLPVCAIGGITEQNMLPLLEAGVDMVAMISAIFNNNSPERSTEQILTVIKSFDSNTQF